MANQNTTNQGQQNQQSRQGQAPVPPTTKAGHQSDNQQRPAAGQSDMQKQATTAQPNEQHRPGGQHEEKSASSRGVRPGQSSDFNKDQAQTEGMESDIDSEMTEKSEKTSEPRH